MTAPSLLFAARTAPDRRDRILAMAARMDHHANGPEGACTKAHLYAAGFTEAEVIVYRDDARAVLASRPSALRTLRPGRIEAKRLLVRALEIHRAKRPWSPPAVGPGLDEAAA